MHVRNPIPLFLPCLGIREKKEKNLRKRYVYWGLQPSKAQFPSGNAIFASSAATRPHQNQNSENPFLQKTFFPPGIGGVERKPEKKIPMIGSHFWPFFGAGLGGENVLGQNSDAQVGPSLQKLRGRGVQNPCFKVFSEGCPLNLGGESAPLKFRDLG